MRGVCCLVFAACWVRHGWAGSGSTTTSAPEEGTVGICEDRSSRDPLTRGSSLLQKSYSQSTVKRHIANASGGLTITTHTLQWRHLEEPSPPQHDPRNPEWRRIVDEAPRVILCCASLSLAAILCAAGGIGGGGIFVTLFMVIGGLGARDAVPLSKAVVFLGSISTFWQNLHRLLRQDTGTLICADACRLLVPSSLLGTLAGVFFNDVASDVVVVGFLVGALCFIAALLASEAMQQYWQSQQPKSSASQDGSPGPSARWFSLPLGKPHEASGQESEDRIQPFDVAVFFLILALVIVSGTVYHHVHRCVYGILHETMGDESKINSIEAPKECSSWLLPPVLVGDDVLQWAFSDASTWFEIGVIALPSAVCICALLSYGSRCAVTYHWTMGQAFVYPVLGVFAGLIAGLAGIGGGLFFSPSLVLLGMDPGAAVATSATCVLFTSFSTTMQYLLTFRMVISLVLVYGSVCFVFSYVGTRLVHHLQDEYPEGKWRITLVVFVGVVLSTALAS
eukprot:CAMPEP_0178389954 /NCGR_PEP_ID=MMETSP0689_2-20121128/10394_1 /TAXON_ID=160604 /ORGANISM="Amphidinium massartii, Strain CS-259" /LENGTH=507 /DNA_ID=CAMNT_0020010443 /DNA_START=80 /DNA_END=1600 /DNA_ORIENTATION=-